MLSNDNMKTRIFHWLQVRNLWFNWWVHEISESFRGFKWLLKINGNINTFSLFFEITDKKKKKKKRKNRNCLKPFDGAILISEISTQRLYIYCIFLALLITNKSKSYVLIMVDFFFFWWEMRMSYVYWWSDHRLLSQLNEVPI